MLSFKVDMESEALKTLQRIINWDTTRVMQNVKSTLALSLARQYQKRFNTNQKIGQPKNVYQAIKKMLADEFGDSLMAGMSISSDQRGVLTGSTIGSFAWASRKNEAMAGIIGTWPANSFSIEIDMGTVMDYLSEVWNKEYIEKRMGKSTRGKSPEQIWSRYSVMGYITGGGLKIKCDSTGLHIVWPSKWRHAFGLHDIHKGPEPFESKPYGKDKRPLNIHIGDDIDDIINIVMEELRQVIDQPKARESSSEYPAGGVFDTMMEDFTKINPGSRTRPEQIE